MDELAHSPSISCQRGKFSIREIAFGRNEGLRSEVSFGTTLSFRLVIFLMETPAFLWKHQPFRSEQVDKVGYNEAKKVTAPNGTPAKLQ